jgi:hypothetical protein
MWGPSNLYEDSAGNAEGHININLLATNGTWNLGSYNLYTTAVTVDGQSCLPGVLGTSSTLGSACGTTGIKFQLAGDGNESASSSSNFYNVEIGTGVFAGMYRSRGGAGALNEPGQAALLYATGSTPVGTHTLSITFEVGNGTAVIAGSNTSTATWTFTVHANPAFTVVAPSSFPALPSYGSYLAVAATHGVPEVTQLNTAFSNGQFCNDNYSAAQTAFDPCSVFNYDGHMVYKYLGDQAASVSASWQSAHSYNVGDQVAASGYVETVTTPGISGGTIPAGFTTSVPGGITSDGGALKWTNGGNQTYWNNASGAVGLPYMDWANIVGYKGFNGNNSTAVEWNIFPWGPIMDFYRQGDSYSGNCTSGSACTGLALGTLNYLGRVNVSNYVNLTGTGPVAYLFVSNGTIRSLPYILESMVGLCEITNNAGSCLSGVEIQRRVNLGLNSIDTLVNYSPRDGVVSPYACCITAPQFDTSLISTALIYYYDLQKYFGLTPDTRIPVALMKLYDWQVANFYNLTGSDYSFPYAFWMVGNNLNNSTYLWQQQLGNLMAMPMDWLWAANNGDTGCTFPTSGLGCRTVADKLFTTTLNSVPGTGKGFNEEYQWLNNITGWRTGAFPATDHYVLPGHNPFGGSYANTLDV